MGIAARTAKDSPEKIRDAASQFEALLISQVLKATHEGEDEGWLGTGEDQTAGSVMGLAEEYFARAMAARGGFGLARMVASGLAQRASARRIPIRSRADLLVRSRPPGRLRSGSGRTRADREVRHFVW